MVATNRMRWFDVDTSILDRRIFSDPEIYRQELTHVFARAYAMGRDHHRVQVDPSAQSRIETVVNEHAQRWTWQEWMQADRWQERMASHSPAPTGVV
jgi:hypothetical protein